MGNTPRITLSINRRSDGSHTAGDLNSLSVGFGLFQVWLYLSVFGASKMFTASSIFPGFPYLPEALGSAVLYSFLIINGICLILIGITNQKFLRFYVTKRALATAAILCCFGTLLLFATCIDGIGLYIAFISGAIMGAGSSLLIVLWGTAFARYQFATIILNTSIASVLGIAVSLICANWVPSPISGLVAILLPALSAPILRSLMPTPFYLRNVSPIFRPLPKGNDAFIVRFGMPVLLIGVILGALRMICVGDILPSGNITVQLLLGAACALSIVIYIIAVALTKRDMFWDTLFRCTVPIVMLGIICIAFLPSDAVLLASFFTSIGFICLEILMWVFFAGVSQEFAISPIFVFGIGRGLLELGSGIGSFLTPSTINAGYDWQLSLPYFALIMTVVLSAGYALLPRYRELKSMIYKNSESHASLSENVKDASEIVSSNERSLEEQQGTRITAGFASAGIATAGVTATSTVKTVVATTPISVDDSTEGAITGTSAGLENHDVETGRAQQNATPSVSVEEDSSESATSTEKDRQEESKQTLEKGSFTRRCEEIAKQYVLSRRETEVLFLLAKGHNAGFIQNKLCVSKSTAKTHINHIYKKLDIHTQQELLNMVEDRKRGLRDSSKDKMTSADVSYLGGLIPAEQKESLVSDAVRAKMNPPKSNRNKSIFG